MVEFLAGWLDPVRNPRLDMGPEVEISRSPERLIHSWYWFAEQLSLIRTAGLAGQLRAEISASGIEFNAQQEICRHETSIQRSMKVIEQLRADDYLRWKKRDMKIKFSVNCLAKSES